MHYREARTELSSESTQLIKIYLKGIRSGYVIWANFVRLVSRDSVFELKIITRFGVSYPLHYPINCRDSVSEFVSLLLTLRCKRLDC